MKIKMTVTFFLRNYTIDYDVESDGEVRQEEVEEAKLEMKNMFEKMYETTSAGDSFKVKFNNDHHNNIYITDCIGARYRFEELK